MKALRFSAVGLKTRSRLSGRTALITAIWVIDCAPVPISAISEASFGASHLVPTPVMAEVRSWPSAAASITATSAPLLESNMVKIAVAPRLVFTQLLKPA